MIDKERSGPLVVSGIPALNEEHVRESEVMKRRTIEIEIPESCHECGFENLNIRGSRLNGRIKVEVRCMRCGKPLVKLEEDDV